MVGIDDVEVDDAARRWVSPHFFKGLGHGLVDSQAGDLLPHVVRHWIVQIGFSQVRGHDEYLHYSGESSYRSPSSAGDARNSNRSATSCCESCCSSPSGINDLPPARSSSI